MYTVFAVSTKMKLLSVILHCHFYYYDYYNNMIKINKNLLYHLQHKTKTARFNLHNRKGYIQKVIPCSCGLIAWL